MTLLQSKTNQFVLQAFSCWTSSTFSVLKTTSYKSIFTIRCLAIWLRMISYILFLRRLTQVLPCLAFLFYFSHTVYHFFEYFSAWFISFFSVAAQCASDNFGPPVSDWLNQEYYRDCMFLLVKYAFQSKSTLYNYLNDVKELLARSRRKIWSLSDCNWTRTRNHLVRLTQPFGQTDHGWVFVYELSGSGFESSCNIIELKYSVAFDK